jgi:precorrin-6B methylase 2
MYPTKNNPTTITGARPNVRLPQSNSSHGPHEVFLGGTASTLAILEEVLALLERDGDVLIEFPSWS